MTPARRYPTHVDNGASSRARCFPSLPNERPRSQVECTRLYLGGTRAHAFAPVGAYPPGQTQPVLYAISAAPAGSRLSQKHQAGHRKAHRGGKIKGSWCIKHVCHAVESVVQPILKVGHVGLLSIPHMGSAWRRYHVFRARILGSCARFRWMPGPSGAGWFLRAGGTHSARLVHAQCHFKPSLDEESWLL